MCCRPSSLGGYGQNGGRRASLLPANTKLRPPPPQEMMKIVKNMLDMFWKSKEMERSRCRSVISSGLLGLSLPVPLSDEQKRGYGPGLPGAQ